MYVCVIGYRTNNVKANKKVNQNNNNIQNFNKILWAKIETSMNTGNFVNVFSYPTTPPPLKKSDLEAVLILY